MTAHNRSNELPRSGGNDYLCHFNLNGYKHVITPLNCMRDTEKTQWLIERYSSWNKLSGDQATYNPYMKMA